MSSTEKLHYVECDSHRQSAHPGAGVGVRGRWGVLLTQLQWRVVSDPREELGNGARDYIVCQDLGQ